MPIFAAISWNAMLPEIAMQTGIYWFLAMGLWINLRVVRYADLAIENTMVFSGMATCAIATVGGGAITSLLTGLGLAFPASLLLGGFSWFAWKALRVHAVIVSLAIGYILYSLSLQSFGAMKDGTGLLKLRADSAGLVVVYGGVIAFSIALQVLRHTSAGRHLLAAVGNPQLASALGMKSGIWQWIGLSIGTLLILISGILHACYYTYVNIGDAVGFLLLGIFAAVLIANGLCPRVLGFLNGMAGILAVALFQSVITIAIYAGLPINLNKGVMGILLIAAVAILRFRRVSRPIVIG
jgi:ABC-type uncharacterized transport system permease subunit